MAPCPLEDRFVAAVVLGAVGDAWDTKMIAGNSADREIGSNHTLTG